MNSSIALPTSALSVGWRKILQVIHSTQNKLTHLCYGSLVGDWKNYFTPELNEKFEEQVLAKLKGTGLEFDFEM